MTLATYRILRHQDPKTEEKLDWAHGQKGHIIYNPDQIAHDRVAHTAKILTWAQVLTT
jgi:hypothetical protein